MDEVTIQNFRCFRELQTARLARLTLLVGENSTGKSSLMAMVSILYNTVFFEHGYPNLNKEPFNLGSFREVAYQSVNGEGSTEEFSGGFVVGDCKVDVRFGEGALGPIVTKLAIKNTSSSVIWKLTDEDIKVEAKTVRGGPWVFYINFNTLDEDVIAFSDSAILGLYGPMSFARFLQMKPVHLDDDDLPFTEQDKKDLVTLIKGIYRFDLLKNPTELEFIKAVLSTSGNTNFPVAAVAPVRSKPLRNYVPSSGLTDSEGSGVANYLAALAKSKDDKWKKIKDAMESFGKSTEMYYELDINSLSDDTSQLMVRITNDTKEAQWKNIIDVGYGVSQILPVIFELSKGSRMVLLQQPEIHLHPRAQAGLGSMLCKLASKQQILVETHSDQLIDRIRMDIRDKITDLKPDDVSILYFERSSVGVNIHNISLDDHGNIINPPSGYRDFFNLEMKRLLEI